MKQILSAIMVLTIALCFWSCSIDDSSSISLESTSESTSAHAQETVASIPETDNSVSVKNHKLSLGDNPSDTELLIYDYFNSDYLEPYYEDLIRYPDELAGVPIWIGGYVHEIIYSDSERFELLLTSGYSDIYIYVSGKQVSPRIIQGDFCDIYATFLGMKDHEVDGAAHSFPSVEVHKAIINPGSSYWEHLPTIYSLSDIEIIAKYIFGENIDVRFPQDYSEYCSYADHYMFNKESGYVVELYDAPHNKFSKFYFHAETGLIDVINDQDDTCRYFEFLPEDKKYLCFTYNSIYKTLLVECYSQGFSRNWQLKFENVAQEECPWSSSNYDYTNKYLYLTAANKIHIIDLNTGGLAYEPVFIGQKTDVIKLSNGILTSSLDHSDTIMFLDMQGNIVWTTTFTSCLGINTLSNPQSINGKIITHAGFVRAGDFLIVLDEESGKILVQEGL